MKLMVQRGGWWLQHLLRTLKVTGPELGETMNDQDILTHIQSLVEEEHALREGATGGRAPDQARLKYVEESLDQYWDLLRQRRAKKDSGENPNEAQARPISEVEGYRQ
jgi:hypothetical protein